MIVAPLPGSIAVALLPLPEHEPRVRAERVVRPELVAHLVGDVVDVERVADRVREPGLAAGLLPGPADDGEARETAATGR